MQTILSYKDVEIQQQAVTILRNVNLCIKPGELVYIVGKVGTGKTSLLKTIYADLTPTQGKAMVLGVDLCTIKRKMLPALRSQMGIVFQDFKLLTDRSVSENLRFVLRATGWKKNTEIQQRIDQVLRQVELTHKAESLPHQLSGGEQQRAAIARAILNNPKLIIADEPTGNLDRDTGFKIMQLIQDIAMQGTAVLLTTHNLDLLHRCPGTVYCCHEQTLHDVTTQYTTPCKNASHAMAQP